MCCYFHLDFRAAPSKLGFIHASSHKMNRPFPVFSQVLWYWDTARVKSGSVVSDHDR
jgi:hypothetical protein